MDIEFRKALPDDLPAMLPLIQLLNVDDEPELDLDEARQILMRFSAYPSYSIYLALQADQVVGFFELLIMDNLAHHGRPSAVIEDVVVHPEWQGKGVGAQMLQFALEVCRAAGCYKLNLSSKTTRSGAHQFYRNLGFEQYGYCFALQI
jgi:GNAT superfamily N-acetyltransferase